MRRWRHGFSAADAVLESDRLILRRFRDEDLETWLAHLNTPQVRAHLGGVDTPAKVAENFARQKASWSDDSGGWLAIERKDGGEFLGYCGFGPIAVEAAPAELQGQWEIGWTLRADCWGRGYATEAARAMLAVAFGRFGLPVIFSQTSEANRGSWRVMERLGMERAPAFDYDDPAYPPEENPTKVYRLTCEAWEAHRA